MFCSLNNTRNPVIQFCHVPCYSINIRNFRTRRATCNNLDMYVQIGHWTCTTLWKVIYFSMISYTFNFFVLLGTVASYYSKKEDSTNISHIWCLMWPHKSLYLSSDNGSPGVSFQTSGGLSKTSGYNLFSSIIISGVALLVQDFWEGWSASQHVGMPHGGITLPSAYKLKLQSLPPNPNFLSIFEAGIRLRVCFCLRLWKVFIVSFELCWPHCFKVDTLNMKSLKF